jgi:hypothetical protein
MLPVGLRSNTALSTPIIIILPGVTASNLITNSHILIPLSHHLENTSLARPKPQEVLSRETLKGTSRLATRCRDVTPALSTRERALAPRAIAQLDTLGSSKLAYRLV